MITKSLLLSSVLLMALFISGCATSPSPNPPATAGKVDLSRYTGEWHEIARLPMSFQNDGDSARAIYGKNTDGTISVHNIAIGPDGKKSEIKGSAKVLNPGVNTKLLVTFNAWFSTFIPKPEEGNYWILHVDEGYQHALVGTPDRRYLWILARAVKIDPKTETALVNKAKSLGYDTAKLVRPKT